MDLDDMEVYYTRKQNGLVNEKETEEYIKKLEKRINELELIEKNTKRRKAMITKMHFVDIINKLKEVNDFVNETNDRARKLSDAVMSDFFNAQSLSISHENIVVELLEDMFNDSDLIGWWLYELDYGRKFKMGDLVDNGVEIDLSTSEKLYDYLKEKNND